MILESLEAENFQKYDKVRIDNLPERGIVGVVGENESGKSTLGEILAFAFFGRTLRLDEQNIREAIHWGRDGCAVNVTFRLDGQSYRVTRELDREGSYSAQLEEASSGKVLAKGVGKVNRMLADLLKIPFEEFRYSFYLGQKELSLLHDSSPDSRRKMLDKMIGINNVEEAIARVEAELSRLRSQRRNVDDDTLVQRELARTVTVDPAEKEKAVAQIREQEQARAGLEGELSATRSKLEQIETHSHALGLTRSLGLRAILRGYGVVFARLAGWLRQGAGQLQTRLQNAERESADLSRKLEDYRVFEARRDELASAVRVRQLELDSQLKNTIEADYKPEDAAFIMPNGKAEQLSFVQKKLDEARQDQERLSGWATRRITLGALLWLGGFALLFWLRVYDFIYFIVFGILYMLWGLVTRSNAMEAEERRSRLSMNSDRLADDVGRCENARQACARFDIHSSKAMADNVATIGSDVIKDLHTKLTSRFGEFIDRPEGYADELIGKINALRDEASAARRELAEVELLTGDLEEEIEALSRGGHARVARPGASPAETYKDGQAREWRGRIRAMIERCRKAQFELHAAPIDAMGRDFAEFEPALAQLPAELSGGLDAKALAELDATSTSLEPAALEKVLETEGDKLAALVKAADELRQRLDEARKSRQELELKLSVANSRLEELGRELGRIEPSIARGVELEKKLEESTLRGQELDREIQVHEKLLEMFEQFREHMRGRFGPQIAEYIRWVLPQLTGQRYQDVRVTPELEVEVFSAEKGSFVPVTSLSGGTADQLFLTLRLAFSKALLHTKLSPEYKQYLFFDEPLSSFDEKRSHSFLEMLKKFRSNFDQVFVVTHTQGVEDHFDRTIRTSIETRELVSN